MKYIIELDELELKGNDLINYSNNNINDKINELNNSKNLFEWEGEGYNSFISDYNYEINKINKLNEKIEKIALFVLYFQNNYYEANEQLKKSWEEYINELEERRETYEL